MLWGLYVLTFLTLYCLDVFSLDWVYRVNDLSREDLFNVDFDLENKDEYPLIMQLWQVDVNIASKTF